LGYGSEVARKTVNAEREVKLSAPREFQLPDLHQLGLGTVRLPVQTLSTSYFDTEDLRLWQRRMTLRHRFGEDDAAGSWTLKLPGKATSREVDRTELSWTGGIGEIPSEATRLLRGIVRRQTLKRVVLLEAKRRRVLVRHGESALGEIDDDIVTVAGEGRTGRTFRQIEFEFDSDTQDTRTDPMVEKMLTALMEAGARIDLEQKFAKALGLDPNHRYPPETKVGRQSTLRTLVQRTLQSDYERLLDFDVYLRLDPDDPPERAIHQARVATRRLRSDLKTFGPVLDPVWLRHTRAELKWMGMELGAVRDIDVLDQRLQSRGQTPGGSGGTIELRTKLASERRANNQELAHALQSDRYLDLLDRLDAGTSFPRFYNSRQSQGAGDSGGRPGDLARRALPSLLGPHWKKLSRRVKKAGPRPSDTQLHRIRIASKQLRYGAELAEPVLGKSARRIARRAEDIQTILGDHHDSVTALEWLERIPAGGTTEASFAAGYRAADARRQQSKTRRQWVRAWGALRSGTATDWLQ
jgi:CHAD domain-containing protein